MPYLNQVTLLGHVGKDVESKYIPNGTLVAKFSLATSKYFKKDGGDWESKTEWHNISVYGEKAERPAKELKKGDLVLVVGELSYRSWTKEDGSKAYMTEIIANKLSFGTKKDENDDSEHAPEGSEPAKTTEGEDDLPF